MEINILPTKLSTRRLIPTLKNSDLLFIPVDTRRRFNVVCLRKFTTPFLSDLLRQNFY